MHSISNSGILRLIKLLLILIHFSQAEFNFAVIIFLSPQAYVSVFYESFLHIQQQIIFLQIEGIIANTLKIFLFEMDNFCA